MRLALAIGASLALAAPAPAAATDTLARTDLTAGPILAGGGVLWADAPSGTPRLLSGGAGRRPAVLARWPAATTKDTGRTVAALAGSGTRVAAVVETCTTRQDYDSVFLGCAERAFGGAAGGPLAAFGRPLPARGVSSCGRPRAPVSVAAGTRVIAVAETPTCQGIARAAARSRIVVHRGASRQSIPSTGATHLRIAGRYLAYLEGRRFPERAVLYDLARRERVRRTAVRAGSSLENLDVQADGTVALIRTDGRRACVSTLTRRGARERVLACRAEASRLAIAGGRVLFAQSTRRGARLVLAGPHARRVLVRTVRPRAIGGFDLSADRAVWTVGTVGLRQRIVLKRL